MLQNLRFPNIIIGLGFATLLSWSQSVRIAGHGYGLLPYGTHNFSNKNSIQWNIRKNSNSPEYINQVSELNNSTWNSVVSGINDKYKFLLEPSFSIWNKVESLRSNFDLVGELKACSWNFAVIFTNNDFHWAITETLTELFLINSISIVHYTVPSDVYETQWIEDVIWDLYHQQRIMNFVWLTNDLTLFKNVSENILQRGKRRSLLYHNVKFVIITTITHTEDLFTHFSTSEIDNIAVNSLNATTLKTENVSTLMWRQHRLREFESIDNTENRAGNTCVLFPNRNLGLNGKHLTVLAKTWLEDLYSRPDPDTGKLHYVGFLVDLMDVLKQTLNFSYTMVPEPGEDDNMTWVEYSQTLGKDSPGADIGSSLWSINSASHFNHTVSYPIEFGTLIGVYVNSGTTNQYSFDTVFRKEVYIVLCIAWLFTVVAYFIIERILFPRVQIQDFSLTGTDENCYCKANSNGVKTETVFCKNFKGYSQNRHDPDTTDIEHFDFRRGRTCKLNYLASNNDVVDLSRHRNRCQKSQENVLKEDTTEIMKTANSVAETTGNKRPAHSLNMSNLLIVDGRITVLTPSPHSVEKTKPKLNIVRVLTTWHGKEELFDIGFRFFGSIFNQSCLRSPSCMSTRFLVWFWCLMVIVLTATYTGNLTADLVRKDNPILFYSFEDLVNQNDYRWVWDPALSFLQVMKDAEETSVLRSLYDGHQRFIKKDPSLVTSSYELVTRMESEKLVVMLTSEHIFYVLNHPEVRGVSLIQENLLLFGSGLVFPQGSELADLVSEHLFALRDNGLIYFLREKHEGKGMPSIAKTTEKTVIDLQYMLLSFYICACGLTCAFVVLSLEYFLGKLRPHSFITGR